MPGDSAQRGERGLHELPERHAARVRIARGVIPTPDHRRKGAVALRALKAVLADAIAEPLARTAPLREIDARELVLTSEASTGPTSRDVLLRRRYRLATRAQIP